MPPEREEDMSWSLRFHLRSWGLFASWGALLLAATVAHADPKPLTKEAQAKVDKAIDRAAAFVRRMQSETGDFGPLNGDPRGLCANCGYTIFPALALLESGVPANDPVIQKVARIVRVLEPRMDRTYGVSLAILFLDRLGDREDDARVRSLALRLIAGQTYTGGWGYYCPTVSKQNRDDLWKTLVAREADRNERPSLLDAETPKIHKPAKTKVLVPRALKPLAIFQDPKYLFKDNELGIRWDEPGPDTNTRYIVAQTDSSNTQFALLALWAAQRHHIPVRKTLELAVKRFQTTQNEDGSWCYNYGLADRRDTHRQPDPRCSTIAALLGLALAHGTSKSGADAVAPEIQGQITNGLAALAREIGSTPAGKDHRAAKFDLYFLWSVERLAALYNLSMIGDKDWYRWGAEILIAEQDPNGAWDGERKYGNAAIRTSFGLLFLKRASFTTDLTAKLPLTGRELNKTVIERSRSIGSSTSTSSGSQEVTPKSDRKP
jgi:hypothetical protein